jgi:predicted transcriptional regulator of viral defense system
MRDIPDTFRPAAVEGLTRQRLWELQRDGQVERVARGLYRRTDAPLADVDLLEIAKRSPRATLCLTSALARHELTDVIPLEHDVAIPRGAWKPVVQAPVAWHHFEKATFDEGRETLRLDTETSIGLYDAPRTIVDCYRMTRQVGADVANEALRRWLRQGGRPADLLRRANTFPRSRKAILNAMQVLL